MKTKLIALAIHSNESFYQIHESRNEFDLGAVNSEFSDSFLTDSIIDMSNLFQPLSISLAG